MSFAQIIAKRSGDMTHFIKVCQDHCKKHEINYVGFICYFCGFYSLMNEHMETKLARSNISKHCWKRHLKNKELVGVLPWRTSKEKERKTVSEILIQFF